MHCDQPSTSRAPPQHAPFEMEEDLSDNHFVCGAVSKNGPSGEGASSAQPFTTLRDALYELCQGSMNPTTANDEEQGSNAERPSESISTECEQMEDNNDVSIRQQLDESMAIMKQGDINDVRNFGDYMQLKKDKLMYQVNVLAKPVERSSALFRGLSIFVNGYTVPPALELRKIFQKHGGRYHCYYEYGKTTYTVASSLANVKISSLRKDEKLIRPEWVVDSVAEGRVLPEEKYLLFSRATYEQRTNGKITSFVPAKPAEAEGPSKENCDVQQSTKTPEKAITARSPSKHVTVDARDPNFIREYYNRSRLHLISTLGQEMKDFISGVRLDSSYRCISRSQLEQYRSGMLDRKANVIFHIDLDCFFVSVALRTRPHLINKPVAITHSRGSDTSAGFSEIASCSYTARSAGLKNGMLIRDALRKCCDLVCLPYEFDHYREVSKQIYAIVARFTVDIRAVSCDEMYLDVTPILNEYNIDDPVKVAEHLRKVIREETGCPASIGIGNSKLVARLATRHAKPDGVKFVNDDELENFIRSEKIKNLPGIGYAAIAKLTENFGEMETCAELQTISKSVMCTTFGARTGEIIFDLARGIEADKSFVSTSLRKSVSCDINYGIRFAKKEELVRFLESVGEELNRKLTLSRMVAGCLTVKVMVRSAGAPVETAKFLGHGHCDTHNKSINFSKATAEPKELSTHALRLIESMSLCIEDLRGIGVQCTKLRFENTNSGMNQVEIDKFFKKNVRRGSPLKLENDAPISTTPTKEVRAKSKSADPSPSKSETNEEEPENVVGLTENQKRVLLVKALLLDDVEWEEPVDPLSLLGETDVFEMRRQLWMYMQKEVTRDVSLALTSYLYALAERGHFVDLKAFARTLRRFCLKTECSDSWRGAINTIFTKLDEKLEQRYGGKMLTKLL